MSAISAIRGMVMPVPTPFLENGEVDEKVFEELLDFYLASGIHAFFINGSYGQGPAMSVEQRKRTAEIAVKRVSHRVPVMVHVGAVDPFTSSDLGRHARSIKSGSWSSWRRQSLSFQPLAGAPSVKL